MAKSLVAALALAALPSALAFRNTSPLFLFSTANLNVPTDDVAITQSSDAAQQIAKALEGCPTKTYFLVRQGGVSSADFLDSRSAPQLAYALRGKNRDIKSIMVLPEVLGEAKSMWTTIAGHLQTQCGSELQQLAGMNGIPGEGDRTRPRMLEVVLPPLPSSQRATKLRENDSTLERLIARLADPQDYTVIYTTTPPTEPTQSAFENQNSYEMEDPFGGAVQMELKRDLSSHRRAASNEGGLFEKYQYFTPPLFMGFVAITPLFLVIFVGLRALSSLQVSYFAFSKEMGPSAQKKQ